METALAKRLSDDQMTILGRRLLAKYTAERQALEKEYLPKRKRFEKFAKGDYSERNTADETSIYSKSNIPMEFITGVADFMVARTCEDIFGSEPFLAAVPQGRADAKLADQITKHLGFKLNEARFKQIGRQAIWRGYHVGEFILKGTWKREEDTSERLATVLVQGQGKRTVEVLDENGDFIEADDFSFLDQELGLALWAKSEIQRMPDGATFIEVDGMGPLPVLVDPDGVPVDGGNWFETDVQLVPTQSEPVPFLSKAPIVAQTDAMRFEERFVEEKIVVFEGLVCELVHYDDFVFPIDCRHLSESQGTFHRLSLSRSYLRENYDLDAATEAALGEQDPSPKNTDKAPQSGEGSQGHDPECIDPQYEIIECWARLPIDDAGTMARVWALVETKSERIVACDYWANVVPGAKSCFAMGTPCPVAGRAYGRGYHEIYEHQADFLDRTFNAIIYRNKMHANPPGFLLESAFKDAAAVKNFLIAPGKLHKLRQDAFDAKQALQFVEIPDLDSRTWQILELCMQMAQVRSGVTGAAQGALTNLPSNGTATGVQSIMLSGSVLHKLPIESVKDGLEDALNILATVLYAHQDKDETFTFMEGDATELLTLTAQSVRGLNLNIRLLLTRLHEKDRLDTAKAAIDAILTYLNSIPEADKNQVRPLFVQVLKALRITGADGLLRDGIPPDPNAQERQLERFTESLNYKDVPDDIKRQMEIAAGYQPSQMPPPAEAGGDAAAQPPAESPAPPLKPENAL